MLKANTIPSALRILKISSTKKYVENKTMMLSAMLKYIACAGKLWRSFNLPAPKFCETIAEMALRVCAKIQIKAERNVPTIPTAASDSIPNSLIFPTTAASVAERTGSAIPEIIAGMASCWIRSA